MTKPTNPNPWPFVAILAACVLVAWAIVLIADIRRTELGGTVDQWREEVEAERALPVVNGPSSAWPGAPSSGRQTTETDGPE